MPSDMPQPYATRSVSNSPRVVTRPPDAMPKAPAGFKVTLFRAGLSHPLHLIAASNGDVLLAEPSEDQITILRDSDNDGLIEKPYAANDWADPSTSTTALTADKDAPGVSSSTTRTSRLTTAFIRDFLRWQGGRVDRSFMSSASATPF